MKAKDLEVNKHYLVKWYDSRVLEEIVLLEKSKSAIKFSVVKQIGLGDKCWHLYDSFDSTYTIIECLSEKSEIEPTNIFRISQVIDLINVQKQSATSDPYNLGLYNGMELCLSILQGREPKFEEIYKTEVKEKVTSVNIQWKDTGSYNLNWYQAKDLEQDGWRLPTLWELKNAYDNRVEGFKPFSYWSSTPAFGGEMAYHFNFQYGFNYFSVKSNSRLFARLCRDV
jgi:hypothetical protein